MIFKYFRRKKCEKLAFMTQNKAKLCKIVIITLVFDKNAIFRRKSAEIAENCDHNIDPQDRKFFTTLLRVCKKCRQK
jgi:hypothetical protein